MQLCWAGQDQSYSSVMLWAASPTTFFSFCRSGEITTENENVYDPSIHLSFSGVAIDNAESPKVISLNIKCSKMDQGVVGVRIIVGKTDDNLCPASALLDNLSKRDNASGALFQWETGFLSPRLNS